MSSSRDNESVRVVFHLNQSWDLVGVFCCAVEHQAIYAGFETEAGAELAHAAGEVCRETISQLGEGAGGVDAILDTFSDRIEIAIHSRSLAQPVVGPGTIATSPDAPVGTAPGANGQELLSHVDRVFYNAENGIARTTLVKYLPAHR
jgi:hypothetical protein